MTFLFDPKTKMSVAILAQATDQQFCLPLLPPLLSMAADLILAAHGRALHLLSDKFSRHFQSLGATARHARRLGHINSRFARKLVKLDAASAIVRHVTYASVQDIEKVCSDPPAQCAGNGGITMEVSNFDDAAVAAVAVDATAKIGTTMEVSNEGDAAVDAASDAAAMMGALFLFSRCGANENTVSSAHGRMTVVTCTRPLKP